MLPKYFLGCSAFSAPEQHVLDLAFTEWCFQPLLQAHTTLVSLVPKIKASIS